MYSFPEAGWGGGGCGTMYLCAYSTFRQLLKSGNEAKLFVNLSEYCVLSFLPAGNHELVLCNSGRKAKALPGKVPELPGRAGTMM